jgi:hypothetical protein
MIHIMYTYKGNFYQCYKSWSFEKAEMILERLGASYWEIGNCLLQLRINASCTLCTI